MEYDDLPHVYHYTIDVEYKKGKQKNKKTINIVTRSRTPSQIMSNPVDLERVYREVYAKNFKGNKQVIVRKMYNEIKLGKVNRNAL